MRSRKVSRDAINYVVDALTKKKEESLKAEKTNWNCELAYLIWGNYYTDSEKELLNNSEDGFFAKTRDISASWNGDKTTFYFTHHKDEKTGESRYETKRIPYKVRKNNNGYSSKIVCEEILPKETRKLYRKKELSIEKEFEKLKELRAEIRGTLTALRTTKKIVDEWPEVAVTLNEYYGELEPEMLPAIPLKQLNKKIFG